MSDAILGTAIDCKRKGYKSFVMAVKMLRQILIFARSLDIPNENLECACAHVFHK